MNTQTARIVELCDRVSSAQADHAQIAELESLMLEDEAVRRTFLHWSAMQADLSTIVMASHSRLTLEGRVKEQDADATRKRWWPRLAVLAAALAAISLAVSWNRSRVDLNSDFAAARAEARAVANDSQFIDGMAIVNRIENVVWRPATQPLRKGDLLKSDRWVEIASGVAEIEFGQGAVVVLEGPARFAAKSTSVGMLDYGKLAAVVPPWAEGFRVDTSTVEIVDRGTQFVMEVTPDQQVSVGVTKGEVEVWQQKNQEQPSEHESKHRLLAGNSVRAAADKISETVFDQQWHTLSAQLPARPDHSEAEVIGRYRRDYASGRANEAQRSGNWRYYANQWGDVWDRKGYTELLWDSRRALYDPNGDSGLISGGRLHVANLSYRGGHPGQGRDQTKDDLDHYVIAAYRVPKAGHYRIESGWLVRAESRDDLRNQAVDLRVWVNDRPDSIVETGNRNGLLRFKGYLGDLSDGDWIYVAVGPSGISYNDRFEWDFAIVRTIAAVDL